ncbi:MAG: extracellular solute-binding protein [Hyphomicrobiales bacterium]|nr:extracellular solute-binding protein [Hyphomicrobiales bacterium]MBV8661560.1 extracellular solute-binding protein [Hyphomicrobiales bacterium]
MRRWLAIGLAIVLARAPAAFAETASPFVAPAPQKPKIVRLLASAGAYDIEALQQFEREMGFAVAYDAYEGAADLAQKWREGPYDLVVLSGPALAQEIARNALAKLDKTRLRNARAVQPLVEAKLAAYDPSGAYAVPAGWFATGLLYDVDKLRRRLGGPPASWANLFAAAELHKLGDCGLVLPDDRDALFIAAWRLYGVDPTRAKALDVKSAAALLARVRLAARAFPAPDVAGALASGAACLAVGDAGEAEAATARSHEGGEAADFAFSLPREGGALSLDAYAIPRDAPDANEAYALLDFLLRPEIAAANARTARLVSPLEGGHEDALKRLWPEGVYDPRVASAVEAEWARLRAAK